MFKIEMIFFWLTVFTYVAAFCSHLIGFISRKGRIVGFALRFLWVGLVFHTAAVIMRWLTSGHPPVTDIYELNLTGGWFTLLLFLAFEKPGKVEKHIALIVTPVVFLMLGHGYISGTEIAPMGPDFRSPWLVVHVIFAWLAFACYAIATGAAVFLLLKVRNPSKERFRKIPAAETLDTAGYRFIVLGFINHAVMIVSGAIWAKKLWGHYWSWDPLETWSLIAFLFYAFYLHARSFLKWKMNRAAWLTLAGLLVLIISFWGVGWFGPTIHPGP
jgi:cytochrome c-type biogenesis protein CcsB